MWKNPFGGGRGGGGGAAAPEASQPLIYTPKGIKFMNYIEAELFMRQLRLSFSGSIVALVAAKGFATIVVTPPMVS